MSCGKLHEPGGFHLHPAGLGHDDAPPPDDAPETDGPGPGDGPDETDAPKAPRQPSRARVALAGAWKQHGYLIKPFGVPPLIDGSAYVVHAAAGGDPLAAVLTVLAGAFAAEVTTETVNHKRKRSHPVRTRTRVQITAATIWGMLASGLTPTGWEDLVQWTALAAGVGLTANHVYETKKAREGPPPARSPMLAAMLAPTPIAPPPPPPDPRLTRFITRFCQPGGALAGATVRNFRELPHGFVLEAHFADDDDLGVAHVQGLLVPIAKLYDTTRDEVTVEHIPGNRTENCCQVIVIKTPVVTAQERRAERAVNRWDGLSTWNPQTGNYDLGLFADQAIAHCQLHKPGSGAMMSEWAGVPGSGKTGGLHVAIAEKGIAKLCSVCGRAGNKYSPGLCDRCDMHRVMAVWVGDAQEQGMSVWRDRGDLTGWGIGGCLELLEFADQVYEARGKVLSEMEWWDTDPAGRPRHNIGKGFFDVEIGFPLISVTIDEWPLLVTHPDAEIRNRAQELIIRAVTLWRKRGLEPEIAAQTLDLTLIGARELREIMAFFNVIGLRLDAASSSMGALDGDPRKLSPDTPGAAYINGPDRRSGTEFTVKYCPEVNRGGEAGIDIRHLAGQIQQTPISYDAGTLSVFERWGVPHQMVFAEWKGRPPAAASGQQQQPPPEPVPPAPAAAPAPEAPAGTVAGGPAAVAYTEQADAVLAVLADHGAPIAFHELMRITDLAVGPLDAALAILTANRQATKVGDKEYRAAA
jgi:hypothetical protein